MSYIDRFSTFVRTKLTKFYDAIKPFYLERSNGLSGDSLTYFINHYPRFDCMIKFISMCIPERDDMEICEIGSFYPYTSYAFKHKSIDMFDIMPRVCNTTGYSVDNVTLTDFNMNNEQLPDKQYDLTIMSEIIEHLPISLYEVEKKVIDIIKPNGYLLVTYPLGNNNAEGYDKDYGDHDTLRHEHLREFNDETTNLFFKSLDFRAATYVTYPAYGLIKLIMYKKIA